LRDTEEGNALRPADPKSSTIGGSGSACSLCGFPLPASPTTLSVNGELLPFCCTGCACVFEILFNDPSRSEIDYRETELYKACVASGLIPGGGGEDGRAAAPEDAARPRDGTFPGQSLEDERLVREIVLKIEGMWCTACSSLVEELLRRTEGITGVQVFFFADLAKVKYLPHRISVERILAVVSRVGYRAVPLEEESPSKRERNRLLLRLGISAILSFNIMMISFALYFGFFQDLGEEAVRYFSFTLWILATPVVFHGGYSILRRAILGLRFLAVSMDTLIAAAALSAYFYSMVQMILGSIHVYFDTAAMLITLVLLGRFIEAGAREKASRGFTELFKVLGGKALVASEGREVWVPAEVLRPRDEFIVRKGERTPLDSLVVHGSATVDQSILTGEPRPVKKSEGDTVLAGTLVIHGEIRLEVLHAAGQNSLHRLIALVQEGLSRKNRMELLADRVTRRLVPAVLFIAAASAAWLKLNGISTDQALLRALTILVITCPCALGIATPLAKVAATGVARARGILVRDPGTFEKAKDLDTIVFDKTGTLTVGNYTLREVVADDGCQKEELLTLAASVEAESDHFLAGEICRKALEQGLRRKQTSSFEAFEGMGVRADVGGGTVSIGSRVFMAGENLALPDELDRHARLHESGGATVAFLGWDRRVRGLLAFGDSVREGAREMIARLHAQGLTTWLVSGDSRETVSVIAESLGISHFQGEALPEDKVEIIRELQSMGHRVAMVGDGINDSAALARAEVGISMGAQSDITLEASQVSILADDLSGILFFHSLSNLTHRIMKQNLVLAFVYNVLGIPLAVAGALTPLAAVGAMFASSLTVIGNTLRISSFRS